MQFLAHDCSIQCRKLFLITLLLVWNDRVFKYVANKGEAVPRELRMQNIISMGPYSIHQRSLE